MQKSKSDELCELVRSMEFIQSFSFERKYCVKNDCDRLDVTIILSPHRCYIGEKRLKIVFCDVKDLIIDSSLYDMYFKPVIIIRDISQRMWENCNYSVEEIEDSFSLKCDYFEYEFLPIADI